MKIKRQPNELTNEQLCLRFAGSAEEYNGAAETLGRPDLRRAMVHPVQPDRSKIGIATIKRLEAADGEIGGRPETVDVLIGAAARREAQRQSYQGT